MQGFLNPVSLPSFKISSLPVSSSSSSRCPPPLIARSPSSFSSYPSLTHTSLHFCLSSSSSCFFLLLCCSLPLPSPEPSIHSSCLTFGGGKVASDGGGGNGVELQGGEKVSVDLRETEEGKMDRVHRIQLCCHQGRVD